jgi:hypothetical protein
MKPSVSSELSRKVTALYRQGRQEEALKALDGICNPSGIEPFPSYSYYLSRAGVLACLERYDEALDTLEEGMERTKTDEDCIPCFVGNCWRTPHLEPLRNPSYRERLEGIVGSPPNT